MDIKGRRIDWRYVVIFLVIPGIVSYFLFSDDNIYLRQKSGNDFIIRQEDFVKSNVIAQLLNLPIDSVKYNLYLENAPDITDYQGRNIGEVEFIFTLEGRNYTASKSNPYITTILINKLYPNPDYSLVFHSPIGFVDMTQTRIYGVPEKESLKTQRVVAFFSLWIFILLILEVGKRILPKFEK